MSIIRDALKKAQEKRESEQANRGGGGPERVGPGKTSRVLVGLALLVGIIAIGITGWRFIGVFQKGEGAAVRREASATVPLPEAARPPRSASVRKNPVSMTEGDTPLARQAERFFWLGDLNRAERVFREALESSPAKDAELTNNIGLVLRKKGDLAGALRLFDRAIEEDPAMVEALNNRAVAYRMLKRNREARADLEKALQLDPDYGHAQFNMATVHEAMGQTGEAIVFYRKYLNNSSRSPGLDEALIVQRISALEASVSSISWPAGER